MQFLVFMKRIFLACKMHAFYMHVLILFNLTPLAYIHLKLIASALNIKNESHFLCFTLT